MTDKDYYADEKYPYIYPHQQEPPRATKILILTCGGIAIIGQWQDGLGHVAWAPLPKRNKEIERELLEKN